MTFEDKYFKRKKPDSEKLTAFGFQRTAADFFYREVFRDGTFSAEITVDMDGAVSGKVFDLEAEDEYRAFRDENRLGEFVGEIRQSYEDILKKIARECFDSQPFTSEQANRIAALISDAYGEHPDFPFAKLPDCGVVRNPENRKWYILIMNVSKDKLTGKRSDRDVAVDVANIKAVPDDIPKLKKENGIFDCYHMNKGNWISVILDGTVSDSRVMELVDISRSFTLKKPRSAKKPAGTEPKKWIIPANPKYYNVEPDLFEGNVMLWKQGKGIRLGDTVYLYVGAPVSAVRCRGVVTELDIPYDYKGSDISINRVMRVRVDRVYPPELCTFSEMNEYGVKTVRGPRFMPDALEEILR